MKALALSGPLLALSRSKVSGNAGKSGQGASWMETCWLLFWNFENPAVDTAEHAAQCDRNPRESPSPDGALDT